MRILIVSASPRRNGNSAAAARRCVDLLGDLGETELLRICDHDIRHCLGCRQCMKLMRCAIRGDDFDRLFRQWQKADVLIVVCPVYWMSPPGAMKDFIDRSHGAYAHRAKPFDGKQAALVSVATDGGFGTHERLLADWLGYYGAKVVGKVRLFARERDDLVKNPRMVRKLDAFIRRLIGTIRGTTGRSCSVPL